MLSAVMAVEGYYESRKLFFPTILPSQKFCMCMKVKPKKKTSLTIIKLHTGCKKNLDIGQRRTIIKEFAKDCLLKARELAFHVASMSETVVALQIIRRILHDSNICGTALQQKAFI